VEVFGLGERKGVIGLDIGSSSIKVAELKETRGGYRLVNLGEAYLPPDAIVNKTIVDPEKVVQTISDLVRDLRVKTKRVVISLAGHSINIKKVSLPFMEEDELKEAIPWELEQYIPHSINDVNYDFQILPGENAEGKMDVLIVAAKKDVAETYVDIVTEAGLEPVILDVDVFALENLYDLNYTQSGEVVALANIGAAVTNINIVKDGVSIFTRDVTTGGVQFTDLLVNEFNVDYEEAERMKFLITSGDDLPPELIRLARDFVDSVSNEIKRTIEFFSKTLWKGNVDRIVLSGGSAKIPYFVDTLREMTGAEVEMMEPFRAISYSESEFDPEYINDVGPKMSVALGLALRRVGDK